MNQRITILNFYKRLLALYPQQFREYFGESMEQTFNDLCTEKRQTKQSFLLFVIWIFAETAIGIVHEHVLLFQEMYMKAFLTNLRASALISLILTLPFIIMEVVNRRHFNEEFPFPLFFVLWLNLFAVSLILLPIVRARRTANHDMANPVPVQRNTLLTNPRSALMISIVLLLSSAILPLLDSLDWLSLDRLFNGLDPEVAYLPGQVISLVLILIPIAAGIIAGGPIVNTLRAGGSLFAHPFHLIIVVLISFLFATGVVGLIVDQWPCFVGVQVCD